MFEDETAVGVMKAIDNKINSEIKTLYLDNEFELKVTLQYF